MEPTNNDVSPATTEPWPYSKHSDVNWCEKQQEANTAMTPFRPGDVPKTVTVMTRKSLNSTGRKFLLPDSDDSDIDLPAIARQIEESQQRELAHNQEEAMIKDIELATQEARAAAEEARMEAEGQELQAAEDEEAARVAAAEHDKEIEQLKAANKKKSRKPRQTKKDATGKKTTTKKPTSTSTTTAGNDDNAKGTRGPTFTATDHLILCKAFIATSEDEIKGNKIGSAEFCDKLAANYRLLYQAHLDEQLRQWNKQLRGSQCSSRTTTNVLTKMPPTTFSERNGYSIWRQFNKVGNSCIKFYSCEEQAGTNKITSGENPETARKRHLELYKFRHEKGKDFTDIECADYLRDKQKWRSIIEKNNKKKNEHGSIVKAERPIGKKKALKEKEKRDLVESIAKSAIGEVIEEKLAAAKKMKIERQLEENSDKQFLAEAAAGLKILLRDATMERVMVNANTPDKADWQKKQAAIALCEMEARSKQAILEMEKNELQTKLDIAKLKMELEMVNQRNKENENN
jgi:hypothetical protein